MFKIINIKYAFAFFFRHEILLLICKFNSFITSDFIGHYKVNDLEEV